MKDTGKVRVMIRVRIRVRVRIRFGMCVGVMLTLLPLSHWI